MQLYKRVLKGHSDFLRAQHYQIRYRPYRTKTAVIVEPRPHEMLRPVVDNVMHFLGSEWNLHVFTSKAQEEWLAKELNPHQYTFTLLENDNLTREQYSSLLRMPTFWEAIPTEHIMIFQTDCIAFRPYEPHWEEYAYVGANYYHPDHLSIKNGGIQGGFSLRRKSAMLECLANVTDEDIQAYREKHQKRPLTEAELAEDVYFTYACEMLNLKMPPPTIRHYFSIEAQYYKTPFGFHGWQHPYFYESANKAILMCSDLGKFL